MPDRPDRPRADEILLEALDRAAADRAEFVASACHGDGELMAEVSSLLGAHDAAEGFLETPAVVVAAPDPEARDVDPAVGKEIGPYRLVERVGSGGMGSVYLAERLAGDFQQRVAVKLILRGLYDEEALRRFRLECQVLARLEHPNIARMIDGGIADDGTPYIVMEYVDGVPIDEYCRREQVQVRGRLALMRSVCGAVEHAHRHSTLHRDLKPSNIMVTTDGTVKLVDFGIARVTDAAEGAPQFTATAQRMMTPPYASPEQMRGEVLSTASDVYSLGVVLCQLLTGGLPYDGSVGALELERLMMETAPARPSDLVRDQRPRTWTTSRQLRGDLDTIVLMALRREPERRYGSAQQLADDIARHLDGRPVLAQPDTFTYRTSKFVRRNMAGVITATLILVLLAASSVLGFTLYLQAEAARRDAVAATADAEANARDAAAVTDFLVDLFQDTDPNLNAGQELTARQLLERGTAGLEDTLVDQPAAKVKLLRNVSEVYRQLGDLERARDMSQEAVELCRAELDDDLELARALVSYAVYLERTRELEPALEALLEAEQLTLRSGGPNHETMPRILNIMGMVYLGQGDLTRAVPYMERSMNAREAQIGPDHPEIAYYLINLAELRRELGDYDTARPLYQRALELRDAKLEPTHPQIAMTCLAYGGFMNTVGRFDQALPLLERSLTMYSELLGENHVSTASVLWELGRTHLAQKRYEDAETLLSRSIAAFEALGGEESPWLGEPLAQLGRLRLMQGELAEAEGEFRRAQAILVAAHGEVHPQLAAVLAGLGEVSARRGDDATAARHFDRALSIRETSLRADHPLIPQILEPYAACLRRLGNVDQADEFTRRVEEIRRRDS